MGRTHTLKTAYPADLDNLIMETNELRATMQAELLDRFPESVTGDFNLSDFAINKEAKRNTHYLVSEIYALCANDISTIHAANKFLITLEGVFKSIGTSSSPLRETFKRWQNDCEFKFSLLKTKLTAFCERDEKVLQRMTVLLYHTLSEKIERLAMPDDESYDTHFRLHQTKINHALGDLSSDSDITSEKKTKEKAFIMGYQKKLLSEINAVEGVVSQKILQKMEKNYVKPTEKSSQLKKQYYELLKVHAIEISKWKLELYILRHIHSPKWHVVDYKTKLRALIYAQVAENLIFEIGFELKELLMKEICAKWERHLQKNKTPQANFSIDLMKALYNDVDMLDVSKSYVDRHYDVTEQAYADKNELNLSDEDDDFIQIEAFTQFKKEQKKWKREEQCEPMQPVATDREASNLLTDMVLHIGDLTASLKLCDAADPDVLKDEIIELLNYDVHAFPLLIDPIKDPAILELRNKWQEKFQHFIKPYVDANHKQHPFALIDNLINQFVKNPSYQCAEVLPGAAYAELVKFAKMKLDEAEPKRNHIIIEKLQRIAYKTKRAARFLVKKITDQIERSDRYALMMVGFIFGGIILGIVTFVTLITTNVLAFASLALLLGVGAGFVAAGALLGLLADLATDQIIFIIEESEESEILKSNMDSPSVSKRVVQEILGESSKKVIFNEPATLAQEVPDADTFINKSPLSPAPVFNFFAHEPQRPYAHQAHEVLLEKPAL